MQLQLPHPVRNKTRHFDRSPFEYLVRQMVAEKSNYWYQSLQCKK